MTWKSRVTKERELERILSEQTSLANKFRTAYWPSERERLLHQDKLRMVKYKAKGRQRLLDDGFPELVDIIPEEPDICDIYYRSDNRGRRWNRPSVCYPNRWVRWLVHRSSEHITSVRPCGRCGRWIPITESTLTESTLIDDHNEAIGDRCTICQKAPNCVRCDVVCIGEKWHYLGKPRVSRVSTLPASIRRIFDSLAQGACCTKCYQEIQPLYRKTEHFIKFTIEIKEFQREVKRYEAEKSLDENSARLATETFVNLAGGTAQG